jgi:hypothetical protein
LLENFINVDLFVLWCGVFPVRHSELHESVKGWLDDDDEDVREQASRIMAVLDDLGLAVMLMNQFGLAMKNVDPAAVRVTAESMAEFVLDFNPEPKEAPRIIRVNGAGDSVQ